MVVTGLGDIRATTCAIAVIAKIIPIPTRAVLGGIPITGGELVFTGRTVLGGTRCGGWSRGGFECLPVNHAP